MVSSISATIIQGCFCGLWLFDRTNILTLSRLATLNNTIAIALAETHLSPDIEDNEINIDGWSTFRGDRSNRKCGGTMIYVKEGLTVSNETSFSNDFYYMTGVFLSNRNVAIVSIYRPPACPNQKFQDVISYIDKWLNIIISSYDTPIVYITGEFNLEFLEDWINDLIQLYCDSVVCRLSEDEVVANNKIQAQELIQFTEKWNLTQFVKEPTHLDNILDLIFVNNGEYILIILRLWLIQNSRTIT